MGGRRGPAARRGAVRGPRLAPRDRLARGSGGGLASVDRRAETAGELREAFGTALGAIPADLRVQAWAVEGPVAQALIGYAHGHDDLLVVGASVRRWPRGDRVARTCLRRAPCPVVVVPAPALARAGRGRAVRRQLCREAEQFVQAHADVLS